MTGTSQGRYLESRILGADPLELVNILYEHAILNVQAARESLKAGDIASRSNAISKVIAILGELDGSLNHAEGGEIALNLGRLYQYMRERLTTATVKQQDAPLAEVESLLSTMGEAWHAIQFDAKAKAAAPVTESEYVAPSVWGFAAGMSLPDSSASIC